MNTLRNTKFWITLATLLIQIGMFVFLAVMNRLTDTIVIAFLSALPVTLGTFGALNVAASGQAASQPPATPPSQ